MVATMKRRSRSAAISWDGFVRYARADDIAEVCADLREMIADVEAKRNEPESMEQRHVLMPLKLASDGGCQLTDKENTAVAQQLREARGPPHIPI